MEILLSEENLFKLCDNLIENLRTKNVSVAHLIEGLKYICYGEEEKSSLSSLYPEDKLLCLLQINNLNIFNLKRKDFIDIANTVLGSQHLTVNVCKILHKLISDADKKEGEPLLIKKLFNHPDFPSVPLNVIEDMVILISEQLELHIISLYSQLLNKTNSSLWTCEPYKIWVVWCCNSPKLFLVMISIMNQLLMAFKNKIFLEIIQNFINNVSQYCCQENLDFVKLYPLQLQHLVSLIKLEIDGNLSNDVKELVKKYFFEQITFLRQKNPYEALIIYSHFSKFFQ